MFILYVAAVMCVLCGIFNLNMNVIWERWGLEFGGTRWAGINVDCCWAFKSCLTLASQDNYLQDTEHFSQDVNAKIIYTNRK